MNNRKYKTRQLTGMLLLASFLVSLNFAYFPGRASSEKKTNVYTLCNLTSAIPAKETDTGVKISLYLFLISSVVVLILLVYKPKSRGPLTVSNWERNPIYKYVTINAP